MTQIILNIKESKVSFFLELIKNFKFVEVEEEYCAESTKDEILKNIEQGLKEVQLIEHGKMKSRSAKEFLNEL
jgi:hypothetical protein